MKLSVCIPTFNRAELLRETLQSFLPQLRPGVQIVVSDNASTDHTSEVVTQFRSQYPDVVYHRWPVNMGADRNYLKTIELAEGEYCWMFGSDDTIGPNAVSQVLEQLDASVDIVLCNRLECTCDMIPWMRQNWLREDIGPTTFRFSESGVIRRYLELSLLPGALFSYLSSIIVRRSAWNSVRYDERFTGTAYSHAFILLSLVRQGCRLKYDPRHLVNSRGGNDSFRQAGVARRTLLDLRGYGAIRDTVFSEDPELKQGINTVLYRQYPWWKLARLQLEMTKPEWNEVRKEFRSIGYPSAQLRLADLFGGRAGVIRPMLWAKWRVVRPLRTVVLRQLGTSTRYQGEQGSEISTAVKNLSSSVTEAD